MPIISDCGGCGLCCLHMGYPPFVGADGGCDPEVHWTEMPAELKAELLSFIDSYESPASGLDGPCCWFDPQQRNCIHHSHRPNVCRDFRVGGKVCRQWRDHYRDRLLDRPDHDGGHAV